VVGEGGEGGGVGREGRGGRWVGAGEGLLGGTGEEDRDVRGRVEGEEGEGGVKGRG